MVIRPRSAAGTFVCLLELIVIFLLGWLMRNAMGAAHKAKRFARIGFDVISLRSENRHRIGLNDLIGIDRAYLPPSVTVRLMADNAVIRRGPVNVPGKRRRTFPSP